MRFLAIARVGERRRSVYPRAVRATRGFAAAGLAAGVAGLAQLLCPVAAAEAHAPTRAEHPAIRTTASARSAAALTRGTSVSTNWSGYAIHRAHVKFRKVTGEWIVPTGVCQSGAYTYSAFWVGIGGYRLNSQALEQVGTELDCTASGRVKLSAWYELVPAPSRRIRMVVAAGDLMRAKVVVVGSKVRLTLTDLTRDETFKKTVTDRSTDITSAEWIAEAPSTCLDASRCEILPLADFGSIGFTDAGAETTSFHRGAISSSLWNRTKIVLASAYGSRYVSNGNDAALATPTSLTAGGRGFTIRYTGPPASTSETSGSGSAGVAARPLVTGRLPGTS